MEQKNKFYVTTPIYYVTAKPHLGSLYSTLLADVSARWNKLLGKNTFFLTGTDEHGQKIAQAAAKAHLKPKEFVDQFIPQYQKIWHEYNIDYSHFIRTTDESHKKAVQEWLSKLINSGFIYKSFYEGWYCTSCETFITHNEQEQAPACSSCGRTTEKVAEESYFFKLSAFQDKLLTFYENNPYFILPKERAQEVINFVKSGLKDLSISRTTVNWGIPFPGDDAHVTYVWADALTNYITAIGYEQAEKSGEFNYWWPADLQILGKDILRFHAVYWPAFLMASNLPLPKHLLVHGWIKFDDKKMSKSFGNVIDPEDLFKTYGCDSVRYYLMREISIAQDTEFSIKNLETRISSDLANDLGNLLNRLTSIAEKNDALHIPHQKLWSEKSLTLRDHCWDMIDEITELMDSYTYHMALGSIWKFIHQTNAYFHEAEPWKIAKTNREEFLQILSATCHSLKTIAFVLWPFMPNKMEELLISLGIQFKFKGNILEHIDEDGWQTDFNIKKIAPLFIKPEPKITLEKSEIAPMSNYISFDDFKKIELCIGTIVDCQEVPKSSKLYQLSVDFGPRGKKQILSGIKQFFGPEELLNKQGVFVVNLEPRNMLGLTSEGMLLSVNDEKNGLHLITVNQQVPNGSEIK